MTKSLFEAVPTENIRLLNNFLKLNKEQSANRGDCNFWLRQDDKIIAVARLIPVEDEKNGLWLRGLFVIESHRNQGIGQEIMTKIHLYLQQNLSIQQSKNEHASQEAIKAYPFCIYAFPRGHLNKFYARLSYQTCQPDTLPESLKTRYLNAKAANKDWLCMTYTHKI